MVTSRVKTLVLTSLVLVAVQFMYATKDTDEKSLYQLWPEVKHPISRHVAVAEILCRTAMSN